MRSIFCDIVAIATTAGSAHNQSVHNACDPQKETDSSGMLGRKAIESAMKKEIACMPSRNRLVFLAILTICGCAPNSDESENRLSDAELLKLNLQCRESADRVAEKKYVLVKGEIYVHWTLESAKYSLNNKRCIAHFSTVEMMRGIDTLDGDIFFDPVSGTEFARKTGTGPNSLNDRYWIASGGLDGPTQFASRDEYLQFTANLMATP
jgi:hypothetical protein